MTLRKIRSLTPVLVLGLLGACGSVFSGADDEDDSGARGGSSGNGSGASGNNGNNGGTNAGKGGKSSGGSGTTGGNVSVAGETGSGSAGEGVIGTAGAFTGVAGAPMGVGGSPPDPTPTCRVGALEEVIFCDDFENPDLPAWDHLPNTGSDDGLTEHVTDQVRQGGGAVRSTKTGQGSLDPLLADVLGQRNGGQLYTRVWLYIPSDQITFDPNANASLIVLGEGPPGDGGVSVSIWAANKVTITVYNPTSATPYVQASSFIAALPIGTWFCLRLDFPIANGVSNSQFHLRVGNVPLANAEADKVLDSMLSGPYERLWLGINYISPQQATPVTVYYDDLAIDSQDIACD